MPNRIIIILSTLIGLLLTSFSVYSDDVRNDDLIVQGSLCAGLDCTDGLDFMGDALRLRENNLRIRLFDTSSPSALDQSWNIIANSSQNGGESYFGMEFKTIIPNTFELSDGTAPLYDCTTPVANEFTLPPAVGVIPDGEPILTPQNIMLIEGTTTYLYECLMIPVYSTQPVLTMGSSADSNAALGLDSTVNSADSVSLGNLDLGLTRQLKNVAAGIAETDALVTQNLNDFANGEITPAIESIQTRIATMDDLITGLEDKVFNNSAPSEPALTSPDDGASDLDTTLTLSWKVSSDADGDELRYGVSVCEAQDFSGCSIEAIASASTAVVYAGFGGVFGLLFLLGLSAPNDRKRWLYVVSLGSAIVLMASCGGGGGGSKTTSSMSHTVSGLSAGTQYFWKVTATDFIDNTDSEVRSFTTAP